ncbi:sulfur carrier protein ThiS [Rhodanobacter umsongensis]|uniref:Sulfur carrier protein ThiS n=1 Tax=Rhodanobacter umsongensis TaxID=633153 RepID=A0ABW0JKM8_9GAMM
MQINVNGVEQKLRAATLAQALDELDYGDTVVATALNGRFVAAAGRASTVLANGDLLEILAPMQGG